MNNLSLLILCLLIPFSAFAQDVKTLEEKLAANQEEFNKNDEWVKRQQANLKDAQEKLDHHKKILQDIENIEKNKATINKNFINEVEKVIKEFPTTQRLIGKKAAFYRCLRDSVEHRGYANFDTCSATHKTNFTASEKQQIESWKSLVGYSPSELRIKKDLANRMVTSHDIIASTAIKQLENAEAWRAKIEDERTILQARLDDIEFVQNKHKNIFKCDENTPDVSLEEEKPFPGADFKGPFVGISRDHQDGLGTCYANAAKNLLVGISNGEDVASFLDLALSYKGNIGVISSGLDGGSACYTLQRAKERGFCPQEFSPSETGQKNIYAEGLLGGEKSTVWDQAIMLRLLQKFLDGKELITRNDRGLSEKILSEAVFIIDKIKQNPSAKLPLPIVRHQIPSDWKIQEASAGFKRNNVYFDEAKFMSDYRAEYRKFYPQYIRAAVEGKGQDEIFETFKATMKPFLDKYKLHGDMTSWKRVWQNDSEPDFNDPKRKESLKESLNFIKLISGTRNKTDEEFLQFCDETSGDFLHFVATLQPLIKHLSELKVDPKVLFDHLGNFRRPVELVQLAIAPACLNSANRKKFSQEFICDEGYTLVNDIKGMSGDYNTKVKSLRTRVVANLVRGYPLGNVFGNHINTIVGMRFNKQTRNCEYKIRESQTGESFWQREDSVFSQIRGLTEVRRK